jgi:hypothetical protein
VCDKFVLDRITLDEPRHLGGDDRFHIVACLAGSIGLPAAAGNMLAAGGAGLLPAAASPLELRPAVQATVLDICLP